MVKKRLLKTIVYRVTTVVMQQLISWIAFHRIAINLVILGCEVVRCSYYYIYDWLWDTMKGKIKKKFKKIGNWLTNWIIKYMRYW